MKFKELSDNQANAVSNLYCSVISSKLDEDTYYNKEGLRLLAIANGSGIALITALVGSLSQSEANLSSFINPLILFLIGLISNGLIYFPFVAMTSRRIDVLIEETNNFFINEKDFSELRGYGFGKVAQFIVVILFLLSLSCFGTGVYQSFIALESVSTSLHGKANSGKAC